MAFTRIKQEKTGEIEAARLKLSAALQCAMEKKNESLSSSDNESSKGNTEIVVKKEPQPVSATTTKKQPQRTQRKRRRKDDSAVRSSNTYVMKLFDRAVDLSPFTEETPLYPICRAWINNQPHQVSNTVAEQEPKEEPLPQSDSASDVDKISDEQSPKEVYQLPAPSSYARDHQRDLRIPSPIPAPEEEFVVCSDTQGAPSKETLMAKHMQRWKAVRQKWKQAAQANEERYRESGTVLKAMFEGSVCHDEVDNPETWEPVATIT